MTIEEGRETPSAFRDLWDVAKRIITPRGHARDSGLHVLPISLQRAADMVEADPGYHRFTHAPVWGEKASAWQIGQALRRAGFYHAVQQDRAPETIWAHLAKYTSPHTARLRTLVLLDGCWFPFNRFQIGEVSLERMSNDDLQLLGPGR